jgi:hypothetical protein
MSFAGEYAHCEDAEDNTYTRERDGDNSIVFNRHRRPGNYLCPLPLYKIALLEDEAYPKVDECQEFTFSASSSHRWPMVTLAAPES